MMQGAGNGGKAAKKKAPAIPRTAAEEEILSLISLCKAGKLFAVQDWIAAGKPVNRPPTERKGVRPQTPLGVAIDNGFHSLVEVLLKAGADIQADSSNGPMDQALRMRRLDIIQLLVEHGYDPTRVPMRDVFETWETEIMEYFIDRGADVETGQPLAEALCGRIRTALWALKRYREQFPHIQEQANVALRHHCSEGNLKWAALMLWAEADPYARGSERPGEDSDDEGLSALGFASLHRHFDVFNLKGIRLQPERPELHEVLKWAADDDEGLPLAEKLLKLGVNPNNQGNGGCSAIQSYLRRMACEFQVSEFGQLERHNRNIDNSNSRRTMRAIHLLARAGGRWIPDDARQVSEARRSLIKLIPDYTLEFVWIMSKYQACTKDAILNLLRTPNMKSLLAAHKGRLEKLLSAWP
jgi:hypothetical protein